MARGQPITAWTYPASHRCRAAWHLACLPAERGPPAPEMLLREKALFEGNLGLEMTMKKAERVHAQAEQLLQMPGSEPKEEHSSSATG